LLGHATRNAFRIERSDAPSSDLGDLASLLVQQFVSTVKSYVSRGRNFEYTTTRQVGALVGGRLDVTRSIKLRARGLAHLLVFDKNTVNFNTQLNRVVLAALREIEKIDKLVHLREQDVARARGLSMLFSDCRDAEVLFGSRSRFIDTAESLLYCGLPAAVRDMVALARVVLANESFEHSATLSASVPRSWFLNLESLFETACRNVLFDTLRGTYTVSRGSEHGKRIFPDLGSSFSANPDLVLSEGTSMVAIGDVKYKTWGGNAAADDIYQLLAHTTAFNCKRAFLVYPSDRFVSQHLGRTTSGIDVYLFAVDVRRLQDSIHSLCLKLGMLTSDINGDLALAMEI
jgi:5-methylcytosine-specific restriction endonuclease McrBC regulatory subunit McrC